MTRPGRCAPHNTGYGGCPGRSAVSRRAHTIGPGPWRGWVGRTPGSATSGRSLHTVANTLVKTHDRLVLETLNITGMMSNHRLAGAIGDAAWGELGRIIAYKQAWRGGQYLPAPRWFPSTKTCSRCHTLAAASMPLSARVFTCAACGHQVDRDLNAAINLAVWGEQHHAQTRDLDARGPVTNASGGEGSGPHPRVGATNPAEGRTPPPTPQRVSVAATPEKGGV
jgi:putative transposase